MAAAATIAATAATIAVAITAAAVAPNLGQLKAAGPAIATAALEGSDQAARASVRYRYRPV